VSADDDNLSNRGLRSSGNYGMGGSCSVVIPCRSDGVPYRRIVYVDFNILDSSRVNDGRRYYRTDYVLYLQGVSCSFAKHASGERK
jgi:hypothetical protein